ncbi:MAG TPA: HEAT repeat domain-containing protein [Rhodocyclaceae bacterium]
MKPTPKHLNQYHVFLASPGDVGMERQYVRKFFEDFNRHTAHIWRARFEVVDWENYSTIGVGRPQELITQQTLEKYRDSLALVIGVMSQRFGSPTGKAESGTEEEFNWAMESHSASGFPEIKWFFRTVDKLELPSDPDEAEAALEQWKKVRAFRKRMQDLNNPVFYAEYPSSAGFAAAFAHDLNQWLADPARPWAAELTAHGVATGGMLALPTGFDAERYRAAILGRFDKLNFEMLDTTGAFYSGVRLWNIFVPQSARECHEYNPRLLEIPKEHQRRLLEAGEITAKQLEEAERQADQQRQKYFQQPLRPILDVMDVALHASSAGVGRKLVILGDPGSGKSSLIRYLALRWAGITEATVRDTQPIPLVVDLGAYGRWRCDGRKDFIRFLEEAPVWHEWPRGLLGNLISKPARVVLLLDGLDEVFDLKTRSEVVDDIQRFTNQFAQTPIIVTSRVVGYQPQRLRDAEFRHFMLQDLDATQIANFVDSWHDVTFDDPAQAAPKRDRLQKAIRESKSIAMLAGNPLLLTMMAILNRNQELPRDRADLYAQASRVLLHQWDTERALEDFPGMNVEIGLREKTDILRRIAAHMQANSGGLKGNLIDGPTLTGLIEDYLQNELHFAHARAAARAVVEQLRQRNFILCFVGADSYAFVHRTFLEYFSAADFVHQFNVAKTLDIDSLIALFDRHCRDDEWREVLRLICGQIDETFVGKIVERLTMRTDITKWDGDTPLPELPLAIWCLSEVRNPERLAPIGKALLRQAVAAIKRSHSAQDIALFFRGDFVNACKEIGTRWPGREELKTKSLLSFADMNGGHGLNSWAHFIAYVLADRTIVMQLSSYTAEMDRSESTKRRHISGFVFQALAEKWPDQTTRELLTQSAIHHEDSYARSVALEELAEKWQDQTTRNLLNQRAVHDKDGNARSAALEALAEKWPDETTRNLLNQRAVHDKDGNARGAALEALAEKWPDQTIRDLLAQSAVHDKDGNTRSTALQALAEKWPDQTTRDLIIQRAVHDKDEGARGAALEALARKWPDQVTRDLLAQRAVHDKGGDSRSAALQTLAEKWPDQTTRNLLAQRAAQDNNEHTRHSALQALAEKWPDQTTRKLLAQRAVRDNSDFTRHSALKVLAKKWPDQATHDLLVQRATEALDISDRGAAYSVLGRMHSHFGRILTTQDLDGVGPYLDPCEPIPREHIEKAAAKAGIHLDDIDAQVISLSAHFGWNITDGARKNVVKTVGQSKPGRKRRN